VNVDQIELRDEPRSTIHGPLEEQSDFGTMGLAILDAGPDVLTAASLAEGDLPQGLFADDGGLNASDVAEKPFGQPLIGALGKRGAARPRPKGDGYVPGGMGTFPTGPSGATSTPRGMTAPPA